MSEVTISMSDALNATLESRVNAAGFRSKQEYLLALVQADCERAELEPVLEARLDGPFQPLEADWKQRVREAAQHRD
jgi:Arc/MetJ-type ribon-helix-helix transcriptional regulator